MRRAAFLVTMIVLAMMSSCGEDGSDDSEQTALSRSEFLAKANATCRAARADLDLKVKEYLSLHRDDEKPPAVFNADLAHFVLLPAVEEQINRVYELEDYARYQRSLDEALAYQRLAIDDIATSSRLSSLEAYSRRFAESGRMLREKGLPACAEGPAEATRYG